MSSNHPPRTIRTAARHNFRSHLMRKTTLLLSFLLTGLAGSAAAADKVTVQLKWLPQAQFAGYYVAQAKGFY